MAKMRLIDNDGKPIEDSDTLSMPAGAFYTVVEDSYKKGVSDVGLAVGIALAIGGAFFKLFDYIRIKNR